MSACRCTTTRRCGAWPSGTASPPPTSTPTGRAATGSGSCLPAVGVHSLFEHLGEDKLVGRAFVYDYPASLCPLTKRCPDNPKLAQRFELYVQGMELANAYTELNDPVLQEATFRQQLAG